MTIIDISLCISEKMVTWKNENSPHILQYSSITEGDSANTSSIKMDLHTGTHVDVPYHFLRNGKKLESMEISNFIGDCYVKELKCETISREILETTKIPDTERILFKTLNNKFYNSETFAENYTGIEIDAAQWLVEKKMKLVGIDYLSVESYLNKTFPVHKILLRNNVMILEGINLKDVKEGFYKLIALPLKIRGVEASPVRAVLISEED